MSLQSPSTRKNYCVTVDSRSPLQFLLEAVFRLLPTKRLGRSLSNVAIALTTIKSSAHFVKYYIARSYTACRIL